MIDWDSDYGAILGDEDLDWGSDDEEDEDDDG